ncbi:hypothetical protein ACFYUR_18555 [Micromonospora haikouensis]|uniref:hypothetical protein n=1 Tax=Micromonospora haikouensis TaxID=686309 RepID=UPI0036A0D173
MTDPSYTDLRRYNQTIAALHADPDVTGDLLLVGMWLARATILRDPPEGENGWSVEAAARDLYPVATRPAMNSFGQWTAQETRPDVWRVHDVLTKDIRRYDLWADQPGGKRGHTVCGAKTPRKPRCGKTVTVATTLTDPATGRRRMVGACRRHTDWWQEQTRANREACASVEIPRPPANAGGALARHISLDWPALWQGLDPKWVPPPEVDGWERPALRLVVSSASPSQPMVAGGPPRPRFALIDGALS